MNQSNFSIKINRTLILLIGLFVTGTLFLLAKHNQSFSKKQDSYEYAMIGLSIWAGEGIRYNGIPDVVLSPGLPIVIGAFQKFHTNSKWSGIILCMFSFILCLFFVKNIAEYFLGRTQYAWLCVLMFMTNSNILINASSGYSEMLFTLIFLTTVWTTTVCLNSRKYSVWKYVTFSFLCSWLYLIRPEGLIIGIILFGWILFNENTHQLIVWIIPIVCFVLIFPYLLFLKQNTGRWQLSGKTYLNLVMGELQSPYQRTDVSAYPSDRYRIIDRTLADPSLALGFSEYWKENKKNIIERIPTNLIKLGKIYWFTFSIIGLGLGVWGLYGVEVKKVCFLFSMLTVLLLLLIFFILPRTVAVYHWIWMVFIAGGLRNVDQLLSIKLKWKYSNYLLYSLVMCVMVYQYRSVIKIVVGVIN